MVRQSQVDKPPYKVPSMAEIGAVRGTNGYTVVSTFSGAGGSCLGYEMAGYQLLWANEFTEQSARIFRLNHDPGCYLDTRDIRTIDPAEILDRIGKAPGEVDIFDGSPPCDAFSMAGKRDKKWRKVKAYSGRKKGQRTDDLFFEYIRLLRGIQPKVFVAENVAGMVRGRAKGKFKEIMSELRASGYTVKARLLDAQWLGVPQARERTIFVGVREGFGEPEFPEPLGYRYSVRDALPWVVGLQGNESFKPVWKDAENQPSPTLMTTPTKTSGYCIADSEDGICPETNERLGLTRSRLPAYEDPPGKVAFLFKRLNPERPALSITTTPDTFGHPLNPRKYSIPECRRISGFPDDFGMIGSYADRWRALGMCVPPLMMRAVAETIRDRVLPRFA